MDRNKLNRKTAVKGVVKDADGKVIAFEIDRRKWGRGDFGGYLLQAETSYFDYDEMATKEQEIAMCCLGIYARACGVPASELLDQSMPSTLGDSLPEQMKWLVRTEKVNGYWGAPERRVVDKALATSLAETNDSQAVKDAQREATIARRFAKRGITVTFTN
jgi:hypothetical protein